MTIYIAISNRQFCCQHTLFSSKQPISYMLLKQIKSGVLFHYNLFFPEFIFVVVVVFVASSSSMLMLMMMMMSV
jgi:ABC-type uncharacterized transport system YnjBCD ATPase subunit